MSQKNEPDELNPQMVGRYIIQDVIGRGGMGVVYLGYDPQIERNVAVKVLPRSLLHDSMFQMRFEREAKAIAVLDHPAVVPIHDFGKDRDQPYIVMRYMSGGTLSTRLKGRPLPMTEILQILRRIGPALDEAHKLGIYHRDIKPSNVLFDKYGHAYLSDFGMVRLDVPSEITGSHAAVGTPGYMSPEQIRGLEIDGRSDLYGLGVVLFEMLTGQRPFRADTPAMIIVKQISDPVPRIRQINPNLPREYDVIIHRLMAKDPDDRPKTATQVIKMLSAALTAVNAPNLPATDTETGQPQPLPPSRSEQSTPTQIARAISKPPFQPPPQTKAVGVFGLRTPEEMAATRAQQEGALEIYCPQCSKIIDIHGQHDPLHCPHCQHTFRITAHLCPNCYTYHTEETTLCINCDTPLKRVCPECYTVNWAGAESCYECRTPLDIFTALQTPVKHGSMERQKRREKQVEALRKASVINSEKRIAEAQKTGQTPHPGRRAALITLGVMLLMLTIFLLIYYLSAASPA